MSVSCRDFVVLNGKWVGFLCMVRQECVGYGHSLFKIRCEHQTEVTEEGLKIILSSYLCMCGFPQSLRQKPEVSDTC
jgi:hypothetical protein